MIAEAPSLLESKLIVISERLWKIALFGPDNYKAAVISHYIYSKDKKLKKHAIQFAKELMYEFDDEEESLNLTGEEALQYLLSYDDAYPFKKPALPKFKFIDLFAGIGGFRLAMQSLQGECIFSSEYDKMAQRTYYANFGEIPFGDITKEETKKWVPAKFDVLCAGFPCQPFSIAGVSKKNSLGRKHGFEDERQGNLFFHIVEIIEKHRPKAFFLENVKNLISHDKGNTFTIIREALTDLGYSFHWKVMNGKHFVPQHRARTFMVGFDSKVFGYKENFKFPELPEPTRTVNEILEEEVLPKYTLTNHLWKYLQDYSQKHKEKGNGFGFGLVDLNGITRTMSARYYKDGSEILIPQSKKNPRRLTQREAARLQGYPDHFIIDAVSMNQSYKQFGNSVVVPLIEAIGEKIVEVLESKRK
ncbi:MAG: DNA (cytosine-5-)-methyltransferase [Ginsengibacter sp.]